MLRRWQSHDWASRVAVVLLLAACCVHAGVGLARLKVPDGTRGSARTAARQKPVGIHGLVFVAQDRQLLLVRWPGQVQRLDLHSGRLRTVARIAIFSDNVGADVYTRLSPNGRTLLFGVHGGGHVALLDLPTGRRLPVRYLPIRKPKGCVMVYGFMTARGRPLALHRWCAWPGSSLPRLDDMLTGKVVAAPRYRLPPFRRDRPFAIAGVALDPRVKRLAASYSNGWVVVYSIPRRRVLRRFHVARTRGFEQGCFSFLAGNRLAASNVRSFMVISARTGRTVGVVRPSPRGMVFDVGCGLFPRLELAALYQSGFNPGDPNMLVLVDTRRARVIRRIRMGRGEIVSSAVTSNGRTLAVGSSAGELYLVDLRTYRVKQILPARARTRR